MNINEIIDDISQSLPEDILVVPDSLKSIGITPEIKLSYYLYKQLTRKVVEADIEFHVADTYSQKQKFYQKDFSDLSNNKILCKQINQAYKKLIELCVNKFKKNNIYLNIQSYIQLLHPDAEMSHSDVILFCNQKPFLCNPILDLLESKADYRITRFAQPLSSYPHQDYAEFLRKKYGVFGSLTPDTLEKLDISIGENFMRNL